MASLEGEQAKHWESAQSDVRLGLDLIAAAQSQLRLLDNVDSYPRNLHDGSALQRAIRRYENCWLPLLAKHGPYLSTGFPLIPPLDCAWVWHCHRLNPVQYIQDCKTYYGKLLDSCDAFADTDSKIAAHTQEIWEFEFPDEKYDIHWDQVSDAKDLPKKITYDLQAAVERQKSFFYQVSRPHMKDELFLKAALQRYKGFLYLLKLSGLKSFLVPTYDIDLMWHSHQASPEVYRQDTVKLFGKVLNHDDTDSDRSEGKKLDTGFNNTQAFWQQTFGSSYKRAGAMYRGEAPMMCQLRLPAQSRRYYTEECSTLTSRPGVPGVQARKTMEVFLAVQKVRNLHSSQENIAAVQLLFANKKCSSLKLETAWINGEHNAEWNDFWALQCEEGTRGIRLELRSMDLKCCTLEIEPSLIGWVEISWAALLMSSTLSFDGWISLQMKSKLAHDQKPTSLRISMSITPPVLAPYLLRIEPSVLSCRKKDRLSKIVFDCWNKKSLLVKLSGALALGSSYPSSIKVHRIDNSNTTDSGALSGRFLGCAEYLGLDDEAPAMMVWSLPDGDMELAISFSSTHDCHPSVQIKTVSKDSVTLLPGRRCQYNVTSALNADESGFMTLVRQSPDAHVAKATALLNWKSGAMEVSPEEDGILVVLLCTIIAVTFDSSHYPTTLDKLKSVFWNMRRAIRQDEWGSVILNKHGYVCVQGWLQFCPWYSLSADLWTSMFYDVGSSSGGTWLTSFKCKKAQGGGCGACGTGGCGNYLKNGSISGQGGSCGACGAGSCGNNIDASVGCQQGGGCGGCGAGGCGNNIKQASAKGLKGGGCGGCGAGGCGNSLNQVSKLAQGGGCGGCGAGGCGNGLSQASKLVQGGGCGGCGAGGCGNSVSQAKGGGCGGCGSGGCGNGAATG